MKRVILIGVAATVAFGYAATGCGNSSTSSGTGGSNSSGGSVGSGGSSKGGTTGSTTTSSTGGSSSSGGSTATSATGGSTSAGGSSGTSAACSTDNGTYDEHTTFATEGSTDPYMLNKWGTWGDSTVPAVTQTTTGPSGLDCSSGCAALTINFSDGTAQYSAGSFVQYFGSSTDAVSNLLNETIAAKIAVTVAQASGATSAVPISINLFGQDTSTSSNGVDNVWVNDLGAAASLDASAGWHAITYKVVDANVPSWSPTRIVCASGLHAIGITIQNNSAIDATNAAVVTLYIQNFTVSQ